MVSLEVGFEKSECRKKEREVWVSLTMWKTKISPQRTRRIMKSEKFKILIQEEKARSLPKTE